MNAEGTFSLRAKGTARIAAWAVLAVLSAAPRVYAGDPAAAEALFREGKALLDAGRLAEACPKFEQSQKLDPSSGTMLNLALCHEKQGRIATAWAEYLLAARMARTQGKADRARVAEQSASALEPKLSYLTVSVASRVPGMMIRRGGTELDESALGSRLPVDPGELVLTIAAPGYKTRELKLQIKTGGDAQSVVVPALEQEGVSPSAASGTVPGAAEASAAPPPGTASPSQPTPADEQADPPVLGWVIGGVGVATLGVGGVFGALALGSYGKAEDACPTRSDCSTHAIEARERAGTQANIANIAIGAGVLGIGIGAFLILTSSSEAEPAKGSFRLTPVADANSTGLIVHTTF